MAREGMRRRGSGRVCAEANAKALEGKQRRGGWSVGAVAGCVGAGAGDYARKRERRRRIGSGSEALGAEA